MSAMSCLVRSRPLLFLTCAALLCSAAGVPASDSAPAVPELTPEELARYRFEDGGEETRMVVSELSLGQKFIMGEQRLGITALMARQLGVLRFQGGLEDLDLLQRIVDEKLIGEEDLETWQALGVVLGDLLARHLDLHWVQVEDDLGVSKALQFGKLQSFVFPVTMLSKRVQFDQPIDIRALYRKVEEDVARFRELEGLSGLNPPDER